MILCDCGVEEMPIGEYPTSKCVQTNIDIYVIHIRGKMIFIL